MGMEKSEILLVMESDLVVPSILALEVTFLPVMFLLV